MSGFPGRPALNAFGPTLLNATAVRDPERQLDAGIFNLMRWQVAGMGLVSPRAFLAFTLSASPVLLSRAEAWNPARANSGAYIDPTFTVNGTGDVTVTWPASIPDLDGLTATLGFTAALAFVVNVAPNVCKHAQAAVVLANPNRLRVCAFNAAGTLEHGNDVVVLGW